MGLLRRGDEVTIRRLALALAVGSLGLALLWRDAFRAPCLEETRYYCLSVSEWRDRDTILRALVLDRQVHGISAIEDPTRLELAYLRTYAALTAHALAGLEGTPRLLFIGGGAYTFPRYVEATYPAASIEVVEIDPRVTELAHRVLGLRRDTRILSHHRDARLWFAESRPERAYDVVYGDAFNDLSIPYHLTTDEFNRIVKTALRPGGWYLATVIDDAAGGAFLATYAGTLRLTYPRVHIVAEPTEGRADLPRTFVVAASDEMAEPPPVAGRIDDRAMADLAAKAGRPLTDDHAPVDNLLAPVVRRRGF